VRRRQDRQASTDRPDRPDSTEPALPNEPTESTEQKEPAEPIDRIDPADPIDRIDPLDPMDKMDPLDPMLRIDPLEPAGRDLAAFRMRPLSQQAPASSRPHRGNGGVPPGALSAGDDALVRRAAPHTGGYGGSSPREISLILRADKMAVFAIGPQDQCSWMMTPRMFLPSFMSW
jgi:hypothetical protein